MAVEQIYVLYEPFVRIAAEDTATQLEESLRYSDSLGAQLHVAPVQLGDICLHLISGFSEKPLSHLFGF